MTNPLWLVRVRMFTTRADSPAAYRGLWGALAYFNGLFSRLKFCVDGLSTITKTEGVSGLFRGTSLALFGVSNGAIQFMAYEKMKAWGFDRKRKQFASAGKEWTPEVDKLVSPT